METVEKGIQTTQTILTHRESSSCRTTWFLNAATGRGRRRRSAAPQHDLHGFSKCAHSLQVSVCSKRLYMGSLTDLQLILLTTWVRLGDRAPDRRSTTGGARASAWAGVRRKGEAQWPAASAPSSAVYRTPLPAAAASTAGRGSGGRPDGTPAARIGRRRRRWRSICTNTTWNTATRWWRRWGKARMAKSRKQWRGRAWGRWVSIQSSKITFFLKT